MISKLPLILVCFLGSMSRHGLYSENPTMDQRVSDQQSSTIEQKVPGNCVSPFHTMHLGVRHIEAEGIGYTNGYTTLEGFGIYNYNDLLMPFLDLRGHVFDNGKLAGNVGIGSRSYLSRINHILGAYLYYDVRQASRSLTAQQLSPGIELLGKRMEYRINGYFPVGNQKSDAYNYSFDAFKGNNIILNFKKQYVMKGFNAEAGVHLIQKTKYDFYLGAGPYYFNDSHENAWGGKVRLNGRYREYVYVEASYSYDTIFRNIVQASVGISIPFGQRIRKKKPECSKDTNLAFSRAAFSPDRFEIPVIEKHASQIKAVNPTTGKPWVVWFVNNTSSSSGAFKSPFPTLAQAESASKANDIIYVFPGNGTALNGGITLKNNQKLFGSGISQVIPTTKGQITIPAFSKSYPLLTGTGTGVVMLANNNEVSGLRLTSTVSNSLIYGFEISGGNVHHNIGSTVTNGSGINITANSTVIVKNNYVSAPPASSGNGITGTSITANARFEFIDNQIIGFSNGIFFDANFSGEDGGEFISIGNSISNTGSYGIFFLNFNAISPSSLIIDRTTITSATLDGINMQSTRPLCARITNNRISSTGNNGIYFENDDQPKLMTISNNFITSPAGGFYGVHVLSFDPTCLKLTNNVVENGEGFFLEPSFGTQIRLNMSGNAGTLTTDVSDGVIVLDPSTQCACP